MGFWVGEDGLVFSSKRPSPVPLQASGANGFTSYFNIVLTFLDEIIYCKLKP